MPYDPAKDPWRGNAVSPTSLGRAGTLVTPSDATDLARYARIRVFAPPGGESAEVSILPLDAADDEPLTLPVPVGQVSILEFLVRRVLATGTTPDLIIHTVN